MERVLLERSQIQGWDWEGGISISLKHWHASHTHTDIYTHLLKETQECVCMCRSGCVLPISKLPCMLTEIRTMLRRKALKYIF